LKLSAASRRKTIDQGFHCGLSSCQSSPVCDRNFTSKITLQRETFSGGCIMSLLISGIVSVILGVIGFTLWWDAFVIILKGGIPIMLIIGGILAVYVGLDAMQDRMKEERLKQEEKLDRTREEIELVKAQAEQYREEIERLKEQAKKNAP
jgi:hypothetical protein